MSVFYMLPTRHSVSTDKIPNTQGDTESGMYVFRIDWTTGQFWKWLATTVVKYSHVQHCAEHGQGSKDSATVGSENWSLSATPQLTDASWCGNPSEYPHKPYITTNNSLWRTFFCWHYGDTFTHFHTIVSDSHVEYCVKLLNMTALHYNDWSRPVVSKTVRLLNLRNSCMFRCLCATLYMLIKE